MGTLTDRVRLNWGATASPPPDEARWREALERFHADQIASGAHGQFFKTGALRVGLEPAGTGGAWRVVIALWEPQEGDTSGGTPLANFTPHVIAALRSAGLAVAD